MENSKVFNLETTKNIAISITSRDMEIKNGETQRFLEVTGND
ncbi:hypothetical protein FACS1894187_18640 [Synergistales bacterium]|nr:hypothetical protein FACS1894187_18640 [Synergistales bacterium]